MGQDETRDNELTAVNNAADLAIAMDDAALNFGGGAGIFDINISLPRGAILGLIGPSGCGKTTTIRLLLLLSIFFTGFFLPIAGFAWPAWIIALIIPMTSGIDGFQSLMLAGESASGAVWVLLGLITAVTFLLVLLIMRRQYRQVLD